MWSHELVWESLSLIPLAGLVVFWGGYVLGWRPEWSGPGVCGRLGKVEPCLGVGYWQSRLGTVMCVWVHGTTSAECIIHSNGPCPRYRTGYGVDTSTSWATWLMRWITSMDINPIMHLLIMFIDHCILICNSLPVRARWDLLSTFVLTRCFYRGSWFRARGVLSSSCPIPKFGVVPLL